MNEEVITENLRADGNFPDTKDLDIIYLSGWRLFSYYYFTSFEASLFCTPSYKFNTLKLVHETFITDLYQYSRNFVKQIGNLKNAIREGNGENLQSLVTLRFGDSFQTIYGLQDSSCIPYTHLPLPV